ncbi:MAG: hypothetical protein JAY74_20200, partial [Candidatus Thiodiazotropha taylori]|nr:hypothetical protein [Candidatus Thiodiazotropha taylori]
MSTHLAERSETEFDEQSETVLAEQSSQPAEQVSVERETRTRTQTEKGREYRVTFLENNFKAALSVWRRASNKASVLMSDCQDADILRAHRGSLEAALDEFHIKFYQLQGLKEDVSIESEKIEQADIEHHRIMQSICECIREIE